MILKYDILAQSTIDIKILNVAITNIYELRS